MQVSVAGGLNPRWRGDSKELYYLAETNLVTTPPHKCGPRDSPLRQIYGFAAYRGFRCATQFGDKLDGGAQEEMSFAAGSELGHIE